MHVRNARLATLALATAFSAAACGGKTDAPAATAGTEGAAATGEGAQKISAEITGAGASFIYPLMARWSTDYNKATGAKINYQSIGSGGGIAQIKAATVDFGSSDKPLSPEELAQAGLGQFPSVIGGVVPVINVEGLQPGQLKLNGTVLADIFLHKITTWNDPAIAALNPGIALPAGKINTVHRSDGSGTTFNFVNYLSKVSPEWKDKVGEGTSVNWPGGVGGKGNEGVAANVGRIKGAIGYVEYAYAKKNKLTHMQVQNQAGKYVNPDDTTFAAAAAGVDWFSVPGMGVSMVNAKGDSSWPISTASFILMHKQPADKAQSAEVLKFFDWAFKNGKQMAAELDYVALPDSLTNEIRSKVWSQIAK